MSPIRTRRRISVRTRMNPSSSRDPSARRRIFGLHRVRLGSIGESCISMAMAMGIGMDSDRLLRCARDPFDMDDSF